MAYGDLKPKPQTETNFTKVPKCSQAMSTPYPQDQAGLRLQAADMEENCTKNGDEPMSQECWQCTPPPPMMSGEENVEVDEGCDPDILGEGEQYQRFEGWI